MNIKKVFLINTEKSERTTIHRKSKRIVLKGFCKTCGTQVEWLTLEEISIFLDKKTKEDRQRNTDDFNFSMPENE